MIVIVSPEPPRTFESARGIAYVFDGPGVIEGLLSEDGVVIDCHAPREIPGNEAENVLRLVYDKNLALEPR